MVGENGILGNLFANSRPTLNFQHPKREKSKRLIGNQLEFNFYYKIIPTFVVLKYPFMKC